MKDYRFPDGFLWGAATAAHQVEGGNRNDWTEWEAANARRLAGDASAKTDYGNGPLPEETWQRVKTEAKDPANYISGDGVDHYQRWQTDIGLLQELNLNAYRFSIEWSRLYPARGRLNQAALKHYRQVVDTLLENNITPMITLHHFTNPLWVHEQGSWSAARTVSDWLEFVETVVAAMPDRCIRWITINEPYVYILMNCLFDAWPSERGGWAAARRVRRHFIRAHRQAYEAIKTINPDIQVGACINNTYFEPASWISWPLAQAAKLFANHSYIRQVAASCDFIGVQQYMHNVIGWRGQFQNDGAQSRSDLGWYLEPRGLAAVVRDLGKYKKPIFVTEHGLADSQDVHREHYLRESLSHLAGAIHDGIDVQGYFHWSLLDNFEWDKGYWPKFGLIKVDRSTMKRTVRDSARAYAQIAKTNRL